MNDATTPDQLHQYFEICKIDEEEHMVWGYASTTARDAQGEIVTLDALKAAWDEYMQFANIREMHQSWAAGIVKEYQFDEVGVKIGAKIVDDSAWAKVKEGVYKGFSIGGKKLPGGYDVATKTITALKLVEISLVDRPANPLSLIEMFKSEDAMGDQTTEPKVQNNPFAKKEDATPSNTPEKVSAFTKAAQLLGKTEEELRKSVRSLDPDNIAKDLNDVSWFAEIMQSLSTLQRFSAWEAEDEADGSKMPFKLGAALEMLAGLFVEMAQEEIGELLQRIKTPEGATQIDVLALLIENASKTEDLSKSEPVTEQPVTKPQTQAPTQTETPVEKALTNEPEKADNDLAKALTLLEASCKQNEALQKSFKLQEEKLAALEKQFGELPQAPKGSTLNVVAKGEDIDGTDTPADVEPVLKGDGTVDEAATAIKRVYATGGTLTAFR